MRYLILILAIFAASPVFAVSGVNPASYDIGFEPLLSKQFEFNFVFDEDSKADLYVSGDLADFVSLDKEVIYGSEKVIVSLDLPFVISTPGRHVLFIGAKQEASDSGGMELLADVRGVIHVDVPYPGKYVELEVVAKDTNFGGLSSIEVNAYNKGETNISFSPKLQIFKESGLVDSFDLNESYLESGGSKKYVLELNVSDYEAGNYTATAITEYDTGKLSRDDDDFRIGFFNLEIINYTSHLSGSGIQPFKILLVSNYFGNIEDVYAEAVLEDMDISLFSTPKVNFMPFGSGALEGHIDLGALESGEANIVLNVYYGSERLSKPVRVFIEKKDDFGAYYLYGGVFFLALLCVFGFWFFVRRMKV